MDHRSRIKILIIEDDDLIRMELSRQLQAYGSVYPTSLKDEALGLIEKGAFDLAFVDLEINKELVGFQILQACQTKGLYSIVLSAYSDDNEYLKRCYKLGCKEFLRKPHTEEGLKIVMRKFLGQKNPQKIKELILSRYITQDEKTIHNLEIIEKIYNIDSPIFISGPSGTGKQVVAEIIHDLKYSSRDSFISINCSEFNESLLESELFGYVKGAFTGADRNNVGRLKLADGGTLFLDEIGTMPLSMQNKLIKAVEEKTFFPVGGSSPIKSNFRLITATSSDLYEQVGTGKFRLDFLYRINSTHIKLYPLAERRDDILFLINHTIKNLPSRRVISITPEAKEVLYKYNWYGNVRELKAQVDSWDQNDIWEVNVNDLPLQMIRNKNPFKKSDFEVITKKQLTLISEIGLKNFIDKVCKEAIENAYETSGRKVNVTKSNLGISNKLFYKYLQKVKRES